MRRELWTIKNDLDRPLCFCVENTKEWAWAMFYSRVKFKSKLIPPSRVPREFIEQMESQGFKAVKLKEVEE